MTVEDACRSILGAEPADAIISDMGLNWAVPAAMAAARMSDDPEAINALRQHVRAQASKLQ